MSIEKFLNEIYEDPATEGAGLIILGTFAGLITLGAISSKIEKSRNEKKLTSYQAMTLKKYLNDAKELSITKNAVWAINEYTATAGSIKNDADRLFDNAITLFKKYGKQIPDNEKEEHYKKCKKLKNEIQSLRDIIISKLNTPSEEMTDLSLKSKVIELFNVWEKTWTSRRSEDALADEIDAKLNTDDDDICDYRLLNPILSVYDKVEEIPYKIINQIKIRVK